MSHSAEFVNYRRAKGAPRGGSPGVVSALHKITGLSRGHISNVKNGKVRSAPVTALINIWLSGGDTAVKRELKKGAA